MKAKNFDHIPETLTGAIRYFGDADRCQEFMAAMRWSGGVRCPRCASNNVGKLVLPRRIWNCKNCRKQFTVKVGTIFEDSPLGLDKWRPATWMIVNAKNGVSSCELARSLGVTQKTGWFMLHRIRLAMQDGSIEKMKGRIEADETFIGGLARNMHKSKKKHLGTGGAGKAAVMGLLERNSPERESRVRRKVLLNVRRSELDSTVRETVEKGSEVFTDAFCSYARLNDEFVHQVIDHAESYAKGHVHTKGLENFWSLLKRGIKATYVSVEPFHRLRYLDEQAFRFNERKEDDGGRFVKALRGITGKGLRYAKLIGGGGIQPSGQMA